MSWKESGTIKLDYEDLVQELNQFEQKAQSLQDRINRWMDDAGLATGDSPKGSDDPGGDD